MKPSRVAALAAVCASAVPAGIIASSNGSAIDAPAPFKHRAARQMLASQKHSGTSPFLAALTLLLQRRLPGARVGLPLAERIARHDAEHEGLEPVVVRPPRRARSRARSACRDSRRCARARTPSDFRSAPARTCRDARRAHCASRQRPATGVPSGSTPLASIGVRVSGSIARN